MTAFVLLLVKKGLTTLKIKSHKFLLARGTSTSNMINNIPLIKKKHGPLKAVLLVSPMEKHATY